MTEWDEAFDVVVVGSGAGGLVGAYVAALHGANVLVVEKADLLGGTTAYSGAGLWFPGNQAQRRAGVMDSIEQGREYIRATVGGRTPATLQDAYLDAGPKLVELLEENEFVEFQCVPIPDYFDAPGRLPGGRHIGPVELQGKRMGALLDRMRPRVHVERLGVHEDRDVLIQGQALVGRLLLAVAGTGKVTLRTGAEMQGLITDVDRVVGVAVRHNGRTVSIRSSLGVLLAAGGFERNDALRREHQDFSTAWTMGVTTNVGQAITAAVEIGADTDLMDEAWWCSSILCPDGQAAFFYGVRGGGIMVNGNGQRFANESMSYDRLGRAMREDHAMGTDFPDYWILDSRFDDLPAIVSVPTTDRAWFLDSGTWKIDDTIEGLAEQLGMPPHVLAGSVERFNRFAETGVDEDFHRGEDEFDLFFGDGADGPNPCLIPLDKPPFLSVPIVPGDLGTKGGLKTDARARVLRTDGVAISGLYAAGNTMASIMGHAYPGPGAPIGTSMVFSYLAALDMVRGDAEQ